MSEVPQGNQDGLFARLSGRLRHSVSKADKPILLTGRVLEYGGGWGFHIEWLDYDKRRMWGHHQRLEVGDEVRVDMESGKTARFAVTNVEWQRDPRDMFFCDVIDIGYVGEEPVNKVVEATEPPKQEMRLLR
jgi:hypothetical protein